MKWEKVQGAHGIWNLTQKGSTRFSANVQRGNLAVDGFAVPIWCFYAEVCFDSCTRRGTPRSVRAPLVFATDAEARAWCEALIVPEVQLEEIGELA